MPKVLVTEFVVRNELGQHLATFSCFERALFDANARAVAHPRQAFTVHEGRHYCAEYDLLAEVSGAARAAVSA